MPRPKLRIFVDEDEFDFYPNSRNVTNQTEFNLDSGTSVSGLKAHYFETLEQLGEICRFSKKEITKDAKLGQTLLDDYTVVATFHEPPPHLPCRLVQHSKGGLMVTGGFLSGWLFRKSTLNVVTSKLQMERIQRAFSEKSPELSVFTPKISPVFSHVGSNQDFNPSKNINLVYAGRLIANKGLSQVIRALNIWNISNCTLTLIGGYEPNFPIDLSNATHYNFQSFFERETLNRNSKLKINRHQAMPQKKLAKHFKESHIFLYPSFHEDENFGLAPREAILSGVIPVVTDVCGLGQLGRLVNGGLIPTWSTLGGVRYSLRNLRDSMATIIQWGPSVRKKKAIENVEIVKKECDSQLSKESLYEDLIKLSEGCVSDTTKGGWRCQERFDYLKKNGPISFQEALQGTSLSDPENLHVDGLGYYYKKHSESKFLAAVQGLYTTYPNPPHLKIGIRLHGFWRVSIWEDEKALVEFGFPGPRLLRFNSSEWNALRNSILQQHDGELIFIVKNDASCQCLQKAVNLGYLVPDQPDLALFEGNL